jgi:hypothetical protein
MAELLIKSSLNPSQLVSVRVSLRQVILEGIYREDQPEEVWSGDPMWILEVATSAFDCDGRAIQPIWSYLRSFTTIDEEITNLVNQVAERVCWAELEDTEPPRIIDMSPAEGATNVAPDTTISITIKDEFPSAGINPDTFKVIVKGYDLTHLVSITGGPFEYVLSLTPGTEWQSAVFEDGDCS